MTVDPFVQPEGAPAASTSKKRRDAYDDLTGVVAEWVSDGARSGRAGKVFSPAALFEGRIDHAVAYSPVLLPRPGETAGAVSSRLGDPATVHPLGMEPVAPGVAYGENRKRLFKPNPSFGMERSRVITRAVMAALKAGEPGPLADRVLRHLDEAIDHRGYSLSNPARIGPSTGRKAFESMKRILLNRRRDESPPAAEAPMAPPEPMEPAEPPKPGAPADQASPEQAGG